VNQPNGAAFTLVDDDVPIILFHLDHQVRKLKMEVINVVTGVTAGFAGIEDFIPRNRNESTSFFGFAWDGSTMTRAGGQLKAAPNGSYRIDLTVLKALGDKTNPAHTEHWLSPTIVISRP
jgi:minor extracellular serine protease Vpr